jgi:hypothetical protein
MIGSFHGKQRGRLILGPSSSSMTFQLRERARISAYEFDFSVSKNKIRCAGSTDTPDFCPVWIVRGDQPTRRRSIIRADIATPTVAPVACGVAAVDSDAAPPASATTPADTAAPTAAATPATAATPTAASTACLRRRGRCADQDGRRADEINEHQSYRCDAARNDIVALCHFRSPGLPITRLANLLIQTCEACYPFRCMQRSFAYYCCCGLLECYEEAQARSSYTAL